MSESYYKCLRLKRWRKGVKSHITCFKVQQFVDCRWVSLGVFGTENDAVDFLVDRAEIMEIADAIVEQVNAEKGYMNSEDCT